MKLTKIASAAFLALVLASCGRTIVRDTEYSLSKLSDQQSGRTAEEREDFVVSQVGEELYSELEAGVGTDALDLLSYGMGESNLVNFINTIVSPGCGGNVQKIIDLMTSTPSSPEKMEADEILALLNGTDEHLRSNLPISPPNGVDTIRKITNLVCKVNNMDVMIKIVHGVAHKADDPFWGTSPVGAYGAVANNAILRLSMVIAYINESQNNMPTVINDVAVGPGPGYAEIPAGTAKLLRMLNETRSNLQVANIINDTSPTDGLTNLTGIINNLSNTDGPGGVLDGVDSMVATLNNINDDKKISYLINRLGAITPADASNDDTFEGSPCVARQYYGISPIPNSATPSWAPTTGGGSGSTCSFASNPILGHNESAGAEMFVNLTTAGTMSFRYKVSSEGLGGIKKINVLTGGTYYGKPTVSISGDGSGATAVANMTTGSVIAPASITTAGSGYLTNPTATIVPVDGNGGGATVTLTRVPQAVQSITVDTVGGYSSVPTISFSGGSGSGAAATATLGTTSVDTLTITSVGSGYTPFSVIGESFSGGSGSGADWTLRSTARVASASVTSQGSCTVDVNGVECSISGGGGTGATCTANTSTSGCFLSNRVSSVTITNGGSGYTSTPTISFDRGGVAATLTMAHSGISVSKVSGGSGYTSNPTVTLTGNATATAQINLRPLSSINVTSGGSYTVKPNVTISGGGGGAATAYVPPSGLQSISITGAGAGYTDVPVVSINHASGGGSGGAASVSLSAIQVSSISITNVGTGYTTEPTVSFSGAGGAPHATASVDMGGTGDYFRFYIDDQLKITTAGNSGIWKSYTSPSLGTGVHRIRWEYNKDATTDGGSDRVFIDDVALPGERGTYRKSYEKIAILMNQMNITSVNTIWQILNGVTHNAPSVTAGVDALAALVDRAEYPVNFTDPPRMVQVVNALSSVSTMTDLLNNSTITGAIATAEQMNNVGQINKVSTLVNSLTTEGSETPGKKLANIVNGLNSQGVVSMTKVLDSLAYNPAGGLDQSDFFYYLVEVVNGMDSTAHMPRIMNELYVGGGRVDSGSSGWTGGEKLGKVIEKAKQKSDSTGNFATCYTNEDSFCVKNQILRLVNEIAATGSYGPENVGRILSYLDALNSPSGMDKMSDVLYALRQQDLGNKYDDQLDVSATDHTGRIITLINSITAADGPKRIAGLINRINNINNLNTIVLNSTKIAYIADMMNMLSSEDLMVDLLNDGATDMNRITYVVNTMGGYSYTAGAGGAAIGTRYIPTGRVTYYATPETNATPEPTNDPLGRMIGLINDVSGTGISNTIQIMNGTRDIDLMLALVREASQVRYLSNTINGLINVDLMLKVLNGYDTVGICSFGEKSHTSGTCASYGGTWDAANSWCRAGNYATEATCTAAGGGRMWIGAQKAKVLRLMNNTGASRVAGNTQNAKDVGDMGMFADVVNDLGYYNGIPRTTAAQVKVVRLINDVVYCGIRPQYDRTVNLGPRCVGNAAYTNKVACEAANAGYLWRARASSADIADTTMMYGCNSAYNFGDYNSQTMANDPRPRMDTVMMGLNDSATVATIVADVTDTQKTVDMMNGARRINTIISTVNYLPGEVTRDLMNYTRLSSIYTGFVYMANNLEPDENESAKAFANMIHYGTGIPSGSARNGACTYYTGIGPKRLAGVLNSETGVYLEGIMQMFGWRTSIPALVCGLGTRWSNEGSCGFLNSTDYRANVFTSGPGDLADSADGTACGAGSSDCEIIPGGLDTIYFHRTETVAITAAPSENPAHPSNYTHTYKYNTQADCENYYPETSEAMGLGGSNDEIVWKGMKACVSWINVGTVYAGLEGVWAVLKGSGLIGWMLQNGGSMGMPPSIGACSKPQYTSSAACTGAGGTWITSMSCSDGSSGNEWDCVKQGKDSAPNVSYYRWGNRCTVPGYTNSSSCENSPVYGRWSPNKNYATCKIDPGSQAPVTY